MNRLYLVILIVLTVLTLLSLTLNGAIIFALLRTQQSVLHAVKDARSVVKSIGQDTLSHTLEVEQEIPVVTSVPFNKEVTVPINTTIPIDTTVIVPIEAGILGTFDIEIPIRTVIPVDMEVAAPVSETVEIAASVPLELEVPVEISIADLPLAERLQEMDQALERLERRLEELPFGGDE